MGADILIIPARSMKHFCPTEGEANRGQSHYYPLPVGRIPMRKMATVQEMPE
jgi:hypothetical protein